MYEWKHFDGSPFPCSPCKPGSKNFIGSGDIYLTLTFHLPQKHQYKEFFKGLLKLVDEDDVPIYRFCLASTDGDAGSLRSCQNCSKLMPQLLLAALTHLYGHRRHRYTPHVQPSLVPGRNENWRRHRKRSCRKLTSYGDALDKILRSSLGKRLLVCLFEVWPIYKSWLMIYQADVWRQNVVG